MMDLVLRDMSSGVLTKSEILRSASVPYAWLEAYKERPQKIEPIIILQRGNLRYLIGGYSLIKEVQDYLALPVFYVRLDNIEDAVAFMETQLRMYYLLEDIWRIRKELNLLTVKEKIQHMIEECYEDSPMAQFLNAHYHYRNLQGKSFRKLTNERFGELYYDMRVRGNFNAPEWHTLLQFAEDNPRMVLYLSNLQSPTQLDQDTEYAFIPVWLRYLRDSYSLWLIAYNNQTPQPFTSQIARFLTLIFPKVLIKYVTILHERQYSHLKPSEVLEMVLLGKDKPFDLNLLGEALKSFYEPFKAKFFDGASPKNIPLVETFAASLD